MNIENIMFIEEDEPKEFNKKKLFFLKIINRLKKYIEQHQNLCNF